jgi:hypothetical protein
MNLEIFCESSVSEKSKFPYQSLQRFHKIMKNNDTSTFFFRVHPNRKLLSFRSYPAHFLVFPCNVCVIILWKRCKPLRDRVDHHPLADLLNKIQKALGEYLEREHHACSSLFADVFPGVDYIPVDLNTLREQIHS